MGESFFAAVQYGIEGTRGTAVAATKILPSKHPPIKTDRKPVFPPEQTGIRANATRGVIHQYLYTNTLSIEHGYFQALPFFFGCGLKGATAGSETTPSQGDYPWDFTPSLTAANSPKAATIELGDDDQYYEVEYCMFESIKLSSSVAQGQDASPVAISGDFFGRQLTPTTKTAGLSLPNQEPLNGKLARLYIDTSWAGIGGTEKTDVLRGFDIEILTGVHPKMMGSGAKTFNKHGEGIIAVMMSLTLERGTVSKSIFTAQQAGSFLAARLEINGGQIGSGVNHQLRVDLGGIWEDVNPMSSEDRGNNIDTMVLQAFYDKTGAKLLRVNMITDTNTY